LITEEGKYYLYRHVRIDTNEVFYIGIGSKCKTGVKYKYKRAYDFKQRSKFWKRIYNKSKENIRVDFLIESEDLKFILEKEKEFIDLYGRKNLNKGSLVNLTNGGDGSFERVISDVQRNKLKIFAKGRRPSDNFFKKSREAHIIKVYQYNLEGSFIKEFNSITEAAQECNAFTTNISKCCQENNILTVKGFIWRYYKKEKIEILNRKNKKIKK